MSAERSWFSSHNGAWWYDEFWYAVGLLGYTRRLDDWGSHSNLAKVNWKCKPILRDNILKFELRISSSGSTSNFQLDDSLATITSQMSSYVFGADIEFHPFSLNSKYYTWNANSYGPWFAGRSYLSLGSLRTSKIASWVNSPLLHELWGPNYCKLGIIRC